KWRQCGVNLQHGIKELWLLLIIHRTALIEQRRVANNACSSGLSENGRNFNERCIPMPFACISATDRKIFAHLFPRLLPTAMKARICLWYLFALWLKVGAQKKWFECPCTTKLKVEERRKSTAH